MFAHLGPMLGPSWADVGASWGYVGASWGYVGRSCAMLVQKHVECHRAKKHCKLQGVLSTRAPHREVRGRGPNMSAHLLAYVGLSCGQCGPSLELCWPSLGLCWPILKAMWADLEAYVGPCWPAWSQKIRKRGTAKKHCKTQDILRVGGGLCWPILGLCWPILGLCWPSLGLCWPILELCWPILGLCWSILGGMLPHLEAMLAHLAAYVGPCWPILSHKIRKMGKNATSTKHCKTREFLATRGGRRQGARPLSPTERRELPYGNATARGPLAGFKGCRPCRRPRKARGFGQSDIVGGLLRSQDWPRYSSVLRTFRLSPLFICIFL